MYRSAQYAAKYGTVNKKKTEDGTEEEAKDEVLVRANGIPTYFAADIATTTTSWPPAALPRPLMSGVPTTTVMLPA